MTDYDDTLGELDLMPAVRSGMTLQELTDRYIVDVLHDCKGNISAAADYLGMFRSSLQRRMQKEPLASKAKAVLAAHRKVAIDVRRDPRPRRVGKKRKRRGATDAVVAARHSVSLARDQARRLARGQLLEALDLGGEFLGRHVLGDGHAI